MFSGSAFSCFYKGVTFKVVAELTETSFRQVCEEGRSKQVEVEICLSTS